MAQGDINGTIDINASKAINAINQLIDKLASLDPTSREAAKSISAVEKSANGIAQALAKGTTSVRAQSEAIKELITQYRALNKEGLKGTGAITQSLNNAVGRANNMSSNSFGQFTDPTAFANALKTQQTAYASYTRNIEAAATSSAKKQQELAFQTYAQNMPKALKQGQDAVFATYAGNVQAAQRSSQALQGLANQRYALYDVATTLGTVSAALLGVAAASVKTGISYQAAFAQVERTTNLSAASLSNLKRELLDLSTELPSSFEEIAGVASLAGQLNVAEGALDDFTETVIKFASTSNVSVDASATALARLAQITDALGTDGAQSYNKLASAILKTGVNSIATESQIVAVTTQIATAGDLAGFSADQIIGLASAFSSLNIAPERARGTVQRVFGQITAAVDSGGLSLENFARVSGMSADAFQKEWKTNAQGAFSAFIEGLEGMQNAGQDTNAALRELGIGAVRDIQALQALANNAGVYADALKDSAQGYRDGTELSRQYAITASTLAARFTTLGSTFRTIINEMQGGALSALSGVVDVFQDLANVLYALSQNNVAVTIGTIVLAGAALIGTLAAVRAAGALATASLYALQTAQAGLPAGSAAASGGIRSLTVAMGQLLLGTTRTTAAQSAFQASLAAGQGRMAASAAGLRGLATAGQGAAAGLKAVGASLGWLAVLSIGVSVLTSFAQKNQESKANVDALTASLDQQTTAITGTTRAAAYDILVKDGTIKKATEVGLSLDTVTNAALGNKDAIASLAATEASLRSAYAESVTTNGRYADSTRDILSQIVALDHVQDSVGTSNKNLRKAVENVRNANEAGINTVKEADDAYVDLQDTLSQIISDAGAYIDGTLGMQNATYALGQSLAENGKQFDLYSAGGRANFAALQQVINSMVTAAGGDANSLATYLSGLMQSLVAMGVTGAEALNLVKSSIAALPTTAGIDFDALKQSALDTGSALSGGYSAGLAKATKGAKSAGSAASDTAKEVRTLKDYVDDLRDVTERAFEIRFSVQEAKDDIANTWADIKQGLKDAAKKDPFSASDFFAKRTDKQSNRDAITQYYLDLVQNAKDAAAKVKQANLDMKQSMADLAGLKADRSVLEYQLKIAQKYGDVLRAQQIQAELAKNSADQAKAQADLAAAQAAAAAAAQDQNKTLKGNSQAAINNRNKVRGLLGTYTDYIQGLIDSGASQEKVNAAIKQAAADFAAQGKALGYSDAQLAGYTDILTDMGTAQGKNTGDTNKSTAALKGNSQAARDNRDAMRDLTQKYQDYILKLEASGAPQSVVKKAIQDSKAELQRQGTQLGLTKGQIENYTDALDDLSYAIAHVPKAVTVKANISPAKQALAEWKAEKTVKVKLKTPSSIGSVGATIVPKNRNVTLDRIIAALISGNMLDVDSIWSHGKNVSGKIGAVKAATGGLIPQYRASGGVAGFHPGRPSGTDTVPAWLSPGEYVVRERAVSALGLPFMNSLNSMQQPKYLATGGSAAGSAAFPSTMMVELSPTDRHLLAAAGNVVLTVNGRVLAAANNAANTNETVRNAN